MINSACIMREEYIMKLSLSRGGGGGLKYKETS